MSTTRIGVVGLGLIGGSLAKALKKNAGFSVWGVDSREEVNQKALADGAIDGILDAQNLAACGTVLVALYPQGVIAYVRQHLPLFQKGTLVIDMAGVKTRICEELSALCRESGIRFIGGHPMAGIEKSGYAHSFAELFDGATMLLCRDDHTDEAALQEAEPFFLRIGFGQVKVTTPKEHDAAIAYTSQLAHIASSAYVKSPAQLRRKGFSGGSYRDLTRVAKLHAGMWTELFLENRESLLPEIEELIRNLSAYRDALSDSDGNRLYALLEDGAKRKIADEEVECK